LPAIITDKLPTIGSIEANTIQNFGGELTAIARFCPDSNQNFQIAELKMMIFQSFVMNLDRLGDRQLLD
jgi:hypothetical protein